MATIYDPDPPTYYEADRALQRSYWEAIGWCLQYGIAVFVGTEWRGLWELRQDIHAHRALHGLDWRGEPLDKWAAGAARANVDHQPTYFRRSAC